MLTKDEMKRIFEDVKANTKKLDECPGPHDFQPHEYLGKLVRAYCCSKCTGTVDATGHFWYLRGLDHGRLHSPSADGTGFIIHK